MNRTKSYNEELSERLRDPKYAQEFIMALMEGPEGLSAVEAIKQTIEIMGVKEFSEITQMASANISAFLKGKRKVKRDTLDQMLDPFHLRTKIVLEKAS